MLKVITIGGKQYSMKASAFTQFAYKDLTGRSLLSDISDISKLTEEDYSELEKIEPVINLILDMSYVMIKEADEKQVSNKEEFLKNIPTLFDNVDWINEVMTLALSPLSRG